MAPPSVSIVVPEFDAAADIERTLASALDQTLRDLEIVVVDDGTSNDTEQRLAHIAANDNRIRLLQNDCNRGPSYTRNAAMDAAICDWVAMLDAVDSMRRDWFEILRAHAAQASAAILADDLLLVHAHGAAPFDHLLPAGLIQQGPLQPLDPIFFCTATRSRSVRRLTRCCCAISVTRCSKTDGPNTCGPARYTSYSFWPARVLLAHPRLPLLLLRHKLTG
jgi:glycosyltransferase involved in cell wall biosynthesis